ncbi:iron-containing alcohol dehydrogenase family protein [Streptomyces sp. NPDC087856]|uniref:iron-containing alcohol dehydrogenase family protein n=1 Tax=Streptomyces sp. NPDC087856 TaxID=3365811 RepID=UPI00380A66BE
MSSSPSPRPCSSPSRTSIEEGTGPVTNTDAVTRFAVPTRVHAGLGALGDLGEVLGELGARRVAVVGDRGLAESGALDGVLSAVPGTLTRIVLPVAPDPDVAAVEALATAARAEGCDVVIGVGGGSALGAAKAVAIRLTNELTIDRYEIGGHPLASRPAPSVAIPTTAGSGSEVSKVLVLHEESRGNELIVRADGVEPKVALLDGRLLRGAPRSVVLYSGLDALSHAMEAQWSKHCSSAAMVLALAAARTILDLLPEAVEGAEDGRNRGGSNDEVLQKLLEASCHANMACGNAGLALVHALSSSVHVKIAHGRQNGALLPVVSSFYRPVSGLETTHLVRRLSGLYTRLGFRPGEVTAEFPAGAVDLIIQAAAKHPFRWNGRRDASDENLRLLLLSAGVPN